MSFVQDQKLQEMLASCQAIVLAGGRGKRIHATEEKSKVMFEVGGKPIISYPINTLKALGIEKPIVVVGFARQSIMDYLKDTVEYAIQEEALGTGDAVKVAMPFIRPETKHVIVLYGDHSTFYTPQMLLDLIQKHIHTGAAATLITIEIENPTGYGRILRSEDGRFTGIVEEKNATEEQRAIHEINSGNAIYELPFLKTYLPMITKNELSGEFYFTDIVALGVQHQELIETYVAPDSSAGIGINSTDQLNEAEAEMQKRGGMV